MRQRIEKKLTENLTIKYLKVTNQSHLHQGHAGIVGDESGETHFDIVINASQLNDLTKINAHRIINNLLKDEFNKDLHALSIKITNLEQ